MQYITTKISQISDPKLKLIYWTSLFLLLLSFIMGLYTNPTWMHLDVAVGNIQIEVEGGASSTFSYGKPMSQPKEWSYTTTLAYDAKELRIPSDESDSLFLATRISPHLPQSRDINQYCGDPTKPCQTDKDCQTKHKSFFGEDIDVCVDFYCLVRAWCPIQFPTSFRVIKNVQNWNIFIKAVATFPVFQTTRTNYNSDMAKISSINTFKVKDILDEVGTDYNEIKASGIVISMTVAFTNCIYHLNDCYPAISFQRIDNDFGFSFLYNKYKPNMLVGRHLLPESRTTFELRGIRIVMSIQGGMYKFSFVGLLLSFGSLIGLLATSIAITDFVLLNIHPNREAYVLQKYRFIDNDRMVQHVDNELLKHLTNLGYY
eukprot:160706_1